MRVSTWSSHKGSREGTLSQGLPRLPGKHLHGRDLPYASTLSFLKSKTFHLELVGERGRALVGPYSPLSPTPAELSPPQPTGPD